MFIIEGSDCLGKTTAAKRMVELAAKRAKNIVALNNALRNYPIRYNHMSRPNAAFNFFTDYKDMICRYAIQDRFHLGALVYHENVMSEEQLRIIEGWLYSEGSVIVILYHSDAGKYKEKIEADTRGNLFDISFLCKTNDTWKKMAYGSIESYAPLFDFSWDINSGYPTDSVLEKWLAAWYRRLELLHG